MTVLENTPAGARPDVTISTVAHETPTSMHTYGAPIPEAGTWKVGPVGVGTQPAPGFWGEPRNNPFSLHTVDEQGADHTAFFQGFGPHDVLTLTVDGSPSGSMRRFAIVNGVVTFYSRGGTITQPSLDEVVTNLAKLEPTTVVGSATTCSSTPTTV